MKKLTLPFLGAMLLMISCNKQEAAPAEDQDLSGAPSMGRKCASMEVLESQIAADPSRGRALEELERKTQVFTGRQSRLDQTLYIPVVVHVVLSNPNIVTDAQIQSQIDVLNRDYNKANSELANSNVYLAGYSYGNLPNCKLQFYRYKTIRKASTVATFGTNDAVKKSSAGGDDAQFSTTALNLWVCDLSSGLLGYAQFPGGAAATDGVVIDYQAFGTQFGYSHYAAFNLGRTATHEIGHWLNLRHIWGDARCGNDFVDDTPSHDADNAGCPAVGLKSRCTGKPLEQWMNYMDYTDDACMYMFSAGQKLRMDAAIDGARSAYVTGSQLTPVN